MHQENQSQKNTVNYVENEKNSMDKSKQSSIIK